MNHVLVLRRDEPHDVEALEDSSFLLTSRDSTAKLDSRIAPSVAHAYASRCRPDGRFALQRSSRDPADELTRKPKPCTACAAASRRTCVQAHGNSSVSMSSARRIRDGRARLDAFQGVLSGARCTCRGADSCLVFFRAEVAASAAWQRHAGSVASARDRRLVIARRRTAAEQRERLRAPSRTPPTRHPARQS